ncbi:component of IIS longevity pathway SMK-1-domain-containing protein [Zychaea mexicana]|uniref:component of IIS longevity pathway SMK-1-domain-containing protein n=1 Tax=Zychaea mexicana TaxID=64656 RepID=UPI0022FDBA56|nr:component of IIS longevity pathway SMK-1-domain-containing protein [Zychaea mexicana]KAI9474829.1 component of IIS longevity pathway SMK-1-domain-containing protein [Zychaea mexicana]
MSTSTPTTTTSRSVLCNVYKYIGEDLWYDQGTGFCVYKTVHEDNGDEHDEILVEDLIDQSRLLISQVSEHKDYEQLEETKILWTEDTGANILALSFLSREDCDYIWHVIGIERGKEGKEECKKSVRANMLIRERCDTATDNRPRTAVGEMTETGNRTPPMKNDSQDVATLPMPELSNLDEITSILSSARTIQDKDRLASFIVLENYIDKLLSVFESCEDLESKEDLHKLYTIMRSIILLNDEVIIELVVRDEYIMEVLGILEYDPQIPDKKATHRRNLAKLSQMKPIVPIHDEWVNSKIQQTLRLQYLNDVILCNTTDDSEKSTLRSLINFNNLALVNYFKDEENQEYLHELFYIFRDEKSSDEMKKEASKFVIQLWIMAKEDQTAARAALARTLAKHGIFDMFPFALCADDELLRTHAANVLDSIVKLDVCLLRKYTIEQTRTKNAEDTTLGTVLKRFALDNTDPGLKIQYAEIIKASMNLGNGKLVMLRKQDFDTQMYLTVFYESYCNLLLRPFEQVDVKPIKLDGPIEELKLTPDQSDICLYLCDLICLAIRQHSFLSRILIRSTDCFVKIAQLYRCKQSHLKLAALRVFRTCIGLSDKFTRLLIKFNVFEPTIRVLLDTDGRYNALNSACLEMLEYIRRENIKLLVEHLITNYGSVLDTISYVTTCEMLRLRHEQNIEPNDSNEAGDEAARDNLLRGNGQDASAIDDAAAEEEYFNNQSSDEEEDQPNKALAESASPNATSSIEPSRGGPLVNYNDSDSSDEEMDNNEEEQQTIAVSSSSSSPSSGDKRRRSFSPDHNKDSNSNNIDTNNNESTLTTAEIEESVVSKSKSPSPSPPTALGTTATTEEQQAERALSPPPLPKRRMDDEDDEDDRRKRTPSPLASSKASPKKIIIKPQIRKLRSNSK